ncbi:hypothetical protein SAMN04487905_111116 [Actinopolyspora xinjiangensis]|uniref:Uncharacterized protein n=1 Tax=Actinopolyspora xinjiangensis TaxID=405564 RepID=A0A1H0WA70_9ACTN|nr:hypothetical protein [Actinopolyspora xinjiangensis]SDP87597.1 hypothetical protein SAMN04487905_111116 [Actinopolyspora xinjiangensis]
MSGFWTHLIVALAAGVLGTLLGLLSRRSPSAPPVVEEQAPPTPAPETAGGTALDHVLAEHRDKWLCELNRCEQAVHRAVRAADAVSSLPVRQGLRQVVHRMDAELPTVRALVQLARELDDGGATAAGEDSTRSVALERVHGGVMVAVSRFTALGDQLAGVVAELAAGADQQQAQRRIAALRESFPLLPAMSAILAGKAARDETPETDDPSSLVDAPV